MKLVNFINLFDYLRKSLNTMNRLNLKKNYPYLFTQGIVDYVDDYIFDGDYILLAEDSNNLLALNKSIINEAKGKFCVNNHVHVIQTNKGMNQKYLYFWITFTNLKGYITGSAQPKLNKENILSIEINTPSLISQQHIVNL